MQFYTIIISILRQFPPEIWVPLGQTRGGGGVVWCGVVWCGVVVVCLFVVFVVSC